MKKIFNILFSLLMLISGMHFTLAVHYCSGTIADTRISVSGRSATCGMADEPSPVTHEQRVYTTCCDNDHVVYSTDNQYTKSVYEFNQSLSVIQPLMNAESAWNILPPVSFSKSREYSPPHHYSSCEVDLPVICSFLI